MSFKNRTLMTKVFPNKMYTLAVLFILVRVICTQECSKCQCCADGEHTKCYNEGYCNNGCIDGRYGNNCEYKCTSKNCLRCYRNDGNYCSKCTSGYYLKDYDCYNCGPQCQSCSSYGCNSCNDGYWGNTCDTKCAPNCSSCIKSNGKCLSCNSGYYVYNGKCTACGTNCAVCGSGGCTSCHDGYWRSTCDENCAQNCALCRKSDGYCLSCGSGYYLYNDKCTACGINCAVCGSIGCTSCHDGYWGSTCDENCAQNCSSCSKSNGNCLYCDSGHYLNNTFCYACGTDCSYCDSTGCQACYNGYWGSTCGSSCDQRCSESKCEQSNGYCLSCSPGYWGNMCEISCDYHCLACTKRNGKCLSCENGYWGHPCTECSRDMCVNQLDCELCTNISFFADGGVCCLCSLDNCVSCAKDVDTVNCRICQHGYYPQINGKCELCNPYCFKNECDSSSGICLHGCINGYWNQTCDKECKPECSSCNQADGSCTQCKNNTQYGPSCIMECSTTCKNSICEINGNCTNGCIKNTFGKQCENKCDDSCSPKDNRTICSEKTGICLYGCQNGYSETSCPQEAETSSRAVGFGGGAAALAAIVVVGLILLRQRKVNLRNQSNTPEKEPVNVSALYATVNKTRPSQAEYAQEDTDNLHSVTIIENTSPPPSGSMMIRGL
ncbi:TENX-like protein [Mya arenaria]|uniref:TENX-like protein n=1 Tax=Mya arenaria TaxID=6604 RepID=A0ABY7F3C7_MYAAR|nr:TENX-like protein [Mya arenaria]